MLRSILAVVTGYLTMLLGVTTFFSFIMFGLLGAKPAHPESFHAPRWLLWAELLVTPLLAALGGYACAWIAKRSPLGHAAVLAGLMLVLGAVSAIHDAAYKPLWSSAAVTLLGAAATLGGARLRVAHARA
jgi:hypothetical protein